jgi:hypothetical protein
MPVVFIRHIGSNLAYIAPLEGPVDPGWGQGGMPGIDNTLPGQGGHPWLPGHVGGPRPDAGLPGSPGHPDNRPPSGPPPQVGPGEVLVLVRDQAGVWHYASLPSGSPPPRPVPVPPGHISGQPIPPPPGTTTPPVTPGTPLPPTAAPKPA